MNTQRSYSIAYLCGATGWGGLEMNQLRNASWMQKRGQSVYVFCFENTPIYEKAKALGLPVRTIEKHRRYYDFAKANALLNALLKENIQHLIFRATVDMSLVATVKFLSKGKIKTHFFMEMEFGAPKKQFFRTLRYRYFDSWNCPLDFLKNQVLANAHVDPKKLNVIPSGLDLSAVINETKEASREILHLPKDVFLFGLIGRFDPKKGQELVIDAVQQMEDTNFHVVFVGENTVDDKVNYDQLLKAKIEKAGLGERFHFLPFQENPFRSFNAFDCTLMASDSETFGMVTIESFAQGTPVIGSNAGGTPEILEFGKIGLLYTTKSSTDLATKMTSFLRGEFQLASEKLKERAAYFNHENVCQKVEDLLALHSK